MSDSAADVGDPIADMVKQEVDRYIPIVYKIMTRKEAVAKVDHMNVMTHIANGYEKPEDVEKLLKIPLLSVLPWEIKSKLYHWKGLHSYPHVGSSTLIEATRAELFEYRYLEIPPGLAQSAHSCVDWHETLALLQDLMHAAQISRNAEEQQILDAKIEETVEIINQLNRMQIELRSRYETIRAHAKNRYQEIQYRAARGIKQRDDVAGPDKAEA